MSASHLTAPSTVHRDPETVCVRTWWKTPLILTGICFASGLAAHSIGCGSPARAVIAVVFGCVCFALLMCMPMLWCAATGFNPHSINPHHCARHDYQFDRRSTLCCDYCKTEWVRRRDGLLACPRHGTTFTSHDGGCPLCARAWRKIPKG